MKESFLMRVLFCKIQCPFICFCKPSATHLYSSGPLKLENAPHITDFSVSDASDSSSCGVKEECVNGNQEGDGNVEGVNGNQERGNGNQELKSCIRKVSSRKIEKKKVKWMDDSGRELAEIKEFESSETGDTDNEEESSRCLCIIL